MRGRSKTDWWGVCPGAPDPRALAGFYSALLGWPVSVTDAHGTAIQVPGTSCYVSFQEAANYVPPVWPAAEGELGATLADFLAQDDVRVLLDPAGHPFCLYLDK